MSAAPEEGKLERLLTERAYLARAVHGLLEDFRRLGLWPADGAPYEIGRHVTGSDVLIAAKQMLAVVRKEGEE